jgi:hypothetical protein
VPARRALLAPFGFFRLRHGWILQAATVDLSGAGSNRSESARIDLAKQAISASLRRERRHRNLHLVSMFSGKSEEIESFPLLSQFAVFRV